LRSICGAAAVIEVLWRGEPDPAARHRADGLDALAAGLLSTLTSKEAKQPTQPQELPEDDLGLAIQQMRTAFDIYTGR
jgi:hypothetical protein